ncbi:HAL/PAL/TAL family ammonia-lyase [Yunchengibacter salinarum]|uniref:HAL/PAL/TAL family ammonia-lyase n=1 Tax=Yunchengibacter salinarum TaxID=3133399 RepID=UPI0035B5C4FD
MNCPVIDPGANLTPWDIAALARRAARVNLGTETRARLDRSSAALDRMIARGDLIYGVTTGFGPLAAHRSPADQAPVLQRNLIYHLASGVGPPLSPHRVRAVMAVRLATLCRGHSGVSPGVVDLLATMLNRDILPVVPEKGTVGASGDLTPLAHMALAMMGEGAVLGPGGTPRNSAAALADAGLTPLDPARKDGLALVNGTAAMTGLAALNHTEMAALLDLQAGLSALDVHISRAPREAFDPLLADLRPHDGQKRAFRRLNDLIGPIDPGATGTVGDGTGAHQAVYSLRCVGQELGAALDVLRFHLETVSTEIASVTDNPVLDPVADRVVHGGNFYGQHVAYASDSLMMAVVKLAVFAERVIARLTDARRNPGLPPFLTGGQPGITSGFMGAQVTASALVAEMRAEAVPASIQSIPTNGDNQDVVTMGTIAARKVNRMLSMARQILAIEAMVIAQAAEMSGATDRVPAGLADLVAAIRAHSAALIADRPLSGEIERLAGNLESLALPGQPLAGPPDQ